MTLGKISDKDMQHCHFQKSTCDIGDSPSRAPILSQHHPRHHPSLFPIPSSAAHAENSSWVSGRHPPFSELIPYSWTLLHQCDCGPQAKNQLPWSMQLSSVEYPLFSSDVKSFSNRLSRILHSRGVWMMELLRL